MKNSIIFLLLFAGCAKPVELPQSCDKWDTLSSGYWQAGSDNNNAVIFTANTLYGSVPKSIQWVDCETFILFGPNGQTQNRIFLLTPDSLRFGPSIGAATSQVYLHY